MVTVFIGSAYTHQVIGGYKGKGMLLSGQVVYLASNPRPEKAKEKFALVSDEGLILGRALSVHVSSILHIP